MPTGPTRSALDRARAEHHGRRWDPARAGFRAAADRGEDLSADDLAAWADAAWYLADNLDHPMAPMLYGLSTLHCLTVSLAYGGTGLGAVWGEQLARQMLAEAGFTDVSVAEVPSDPLNSLYVAR